MIKIAIVEDFNSDMDLLYNYINKFFADKGIDLELLTFVKGEDLITNYPTNLDVIFLDIEMDNLNGIDTAKKVRRFDDNVLIVFITNFVHYAVEGYCVEALDFLVKPISYFRVSNELEKLLSKIDKKKPKHLIIKNDDYIHKINIEDILYIETVKRKLLIHTNKENFYSNNTMNCMEKMLKSYHFYRPHTSYLVNLKYVISIQSNDILLKNTLIPMSRYKKKDFNEAFLRYLGDSL